MSPIGRGRPRSQSNARTRRGKVRRMSLTGQGRPAGEQVPAARLVPAGSEPVVEASIDLITYKAQQMVSFSPSFPVTPAEAGGKRESTSIQGPWIPAFAGMTGFCRARARVSIDPRAKTELWA